MDKPLAHAMNGLQRLRLNVESCTAVSYSEFPLDKTGCTRKDCIGCGRGHYDQIDDIHFDCRSRQGARGRRYGKIARLRLTVGKPSGLDAAARIDPVVARFDAPAGKLGRQVRI
jgi:hypothetical protein